MSHRNSRAPATILVTALLIIILLSSTQTTYRLSPAPAKADVASASCDAAPAVLPRRPAELSRACPWPHRTRHLWAEAASDAESVPRANMALDARTALGQAQAAK